jgi:mRNA-degrading endonuclease toxin of MazEF toxin-antitoxin module
MGSRSMRRGEIRLVALEPARGAETDKLRPAAEQVRSVDVRRVGRRVGRLPGDVLDELNEALRLHLAL